jgi:hypothetical protein
LFRDIVWADWRFEQWQSKKNVSANLQLTAIGPASAPIQRLTTACAKSATRRGGQQKQILMGSRDRAVSDQRLGRTTTEVPGAGWDRTLLQRVLG